MYCIPSVDVYVIGAGGGSIARIDAAHVLRVGPQSAGADPGPACYNKGGEWPTVTDADLVLGYLNPDYFLGGEIKLHPELARKAIKEKIADPLKIDVIEAAVAIDHIVNSNMADGIRMVTVRRGEDPRRYNLVTAGGAGPVHAVRLAQEMEISKILIPKQSSVFCPMGMLSTDLRHDFTRTYMSQTEKANPDTVNRLYQEMEAEGNELLAEEGIAMKDREFYRSAEVRYVGQIHEVEAEVPKGTLTLMSLQDMENAFHERHETLYSYKEVGSPTAIQSLRLVAIGKLVRLSVVKEERAKEDCSKAIKARRKVYFAEYGEYIETPIYDDLRLAYGNTIEGPGIVEQATTTVVVPPKNKLEVDEYGNYIINTIREG
jgi:N-methylhydantoinase A